MVYSPNSPSDEKRYTKDKENWKEIKNKRQLDGRSFVRRRKSSNFLIMI